jgi:hypothetical protein
MKRNRAVLVISDQHIPYHHKDMFRFLKAIKKKYLDSIPSIQSAVINIGDEVDQHAMSFHPSDQDLYSAGDELEESIKYLGIMAKLFPSMTIVDSNHGSMKIRKSKVNGMPLKYLRTNNEIYEVPNTWKWVEDITLTLSNGQQCHFCHGKIKSSLKLSQQMSMNVVQGHYHEEFAIHYWSNPHDLYWGMNVGCLIDNKSMAFAYNKVFPKRPIIGVGIILDGLPKLLPMLLDNDGKWTGYVP